MCNLLGFKHPHSRKCIKYFVWKRQPESTITGRFPSQKTSNTLLLCLFGDRPRELLSNQLSGLWLEASLRLCDVTVMHVRPTHGLRPEHASLGRESSPEGRIKFKIMEFVVCLSKQKLLCALIDYKKLFDYIERTFLWLKLISYGIKGDILIVDGEGYIYIL